MLNSAAAAFRQNSARRFGAKRFSAHRWRAGHVSVITALAAAPMTVIVGGTLDISAAINTRAKVLNALDAAGLAAGRTLAIDTAAILKETNAFLAANLTASELAMVSGLGVTVDGPVLSFRATVTAPSTFLAATGIEVVALPVRSDIHRNVRKVELALVLDNTGSMNSSGKIEALRSAAQQLVAGLFLGEQTSENVKVSVVPYVTAVNVRSANFDWDWIDQTGAATHNGVNFEPRTDHLELFDRMDVPWKGCVEMRAAPYDLTDDPPDSEAPDTLWVPYLWPDEPQNNGGGSQEEYHNDYIYDDEDHCTTCAGLSGEALRVAQQRDVAKYDEPLDRRDEIPIETWGPNKSCARPILPLTNRQADIQHELSEMRPWNNSGTNGAAGLAWGWRVLSPTEPYTEGTPYGDADVMKAIVLMTDGENIIFGGYNSHNLSNYSSYGYLSQNRLGTTNQNTAKTRINERLTTLCDRIKAEGIVVFTVTFRLNSNALKQVFRDCATEPSYYFDSQSNSAIVDHFLAIAGELSELRIAQ